MALQQFSAGLPPEGYFDAIVEALRNPGWIVLPNFLEQSLWLPLLQRAQNIDNYAPAGIGRGDTFRENPFVRSDAICWLDRENFEDAQWLTLMEKLRLALNSRLFLGLFEFECHYASYGCGSFYKRHLDAFKGQGIRIVSVVLYLNPQWQSGDGGEFVIYPEKAPEGVAFLPRAGTLAIFLSEDFPHEVLPANRIRYSITGWFRINTTTGEILDPPR
ncbi:MAG: 2OG-Fe(II) oxygenase [Porticoccaceae bacterium]